MIFGVGTQSVVHCATSTIVDVAAEVGPGKTDRSWFIEGFYAVGSVLAKVAAGGGDEGVPTSEVCERNVLVLDEIGAGDGAVVVNPPGTVRGGCWIVRKARFDIADSGVDTRSDPSPAIFGKKYN